MIDRGKHEEILQFQKAILEGNHEVAERIIIESKHASKSQILVWTWHVKSIKEEFKIKDLFLAVLENNFSLGLLYLYFENCLDRRDLANFEKMYDLIPVEKLDKDSPIYFSVIGNFLRRIKSKQEYIIKARFLYTRRDPEFLRYLS